MLRSAKSSAPFRSGSGSSSGLGSGSGSGASGSSSNIFSNNGQPSSSESGQHPNLGLHSAAANGNVGLVKFALDNGQPTNSVLHGLLPLHAACSGGSEPVVRLLISYGADVNGTRIKTTKANAPGPGTGAEGSTPLHFASANGHLSIVKLLLENGARPTSRDRDRQTPLSLASSQGHAACVSVLKSWIDAHGPNGLSRPRSRGNSFQDQQNQSSPIRSQRSFESLSSAAAGVKASLKSHKKQALAKVSSNPNLKSIASSSSYYGSPPSLPPPLPGITRAGSESSTPPQTLSSVPNVFSQDYKRRPSLPSIFERAVHPSSTITRLLPTPPSYSNQPESIEELNMDAKDMRPPISPSRPSHRLTGKRSLTGLLSKASSSNVSEASPLPLMDAKYAKQAPQVNAEEGRLTLLPVPTSARARSGSVDALSQPSAGQFVRSEVGSATMVNSPSSSMDNYDGSARKNSAPSIGYRPRKSSNLSITASNPSSGMVSSDDQGSSGSLSIDHGRKRSQSATSVPRQTVPTPDMDLSRKAFLSQRGTASSKMQNESQIDDIKEVLQSDQSSQRAKSNAATRYRSHRSPLLSSKLLVEETDSRNPSSPSVGLRQLQSQRSTSSLVSSASSSNTNPRPTRGNSFTGAGVEEEEEQGSRSHLGPGGASRSHGSSGYPESTASKTSTSSVRSYGIGLSAQEQAQAILRTAEDRASFSGDVPAISLTQMLAAYGEALAQERKGATYSPDKLRKQPSMASITSNSRNYQLPSVTEVPMLTPDSDDQSKPIQRTQARTLTPITTPPESPQMVRSRTESSVTSYSRSLSSQRQRGKGTNDAASASLSPQIHTLQPTSTSPKLTSNGRQLEPAWNMETAETAQSKVALVKDSSPIPIDMLSHRHSPSLPTDLSQFANSSPLTAPSSTETTPRSKRQMQHRPTVSDAHSSLDQIISKQTDSPSPLSTTKSSVPHTPELYQTPSVNATDAEARTPLSEFDLSPGVTFVNQTSLPDPSLAAAASQSEKDSSSRLTPTTSQAAGGKRKGAVKAFLHGIKNNVALR